MAMKKENYSNNVFGDMASRNENWTEIDTTFALKADKSTTYTKTEVDTSLELKADKTYVDNQDTALTAQLAETDQRIDAIITTPVPTGEIIAQEIIDARQGKASLGANINEVKTSLADIPNNYIKGKEVTTNVQTDGKNTTFGHASNKIADDVSTSVIIGGGSTGYNNIIGGDGANVNTANPNATTPGTGAHVSVVGGYDNSAGSLSSKIISDHSKTEIGGAGHNAIYGGTSHVIKSTASFAMIAGGQNNEVSGQGGFATGQRNKSGGTCSACFGYDNVITANGGFAVGGANTINNVFGFTFGSSNTVSGNFSKAEGNHAHSRTLGQQVFTGGRFKALGDAQTSVIEMHRQTTDATTVTLGVVGSNTSHQLLPNQSVAFSILLVARDTAGTDTATWEIKGMARRGATGSTLLVGTTITSLGADAGTSAWVVTVTGDSAGGLNVRITGEIGKTVRWVQRMTLVEVMI